MGVKEDYVKQIAGLDKSTVDAGIDELEGGPLLAPSLFQEDALKHFDYDGADDRTSQVKFLVKKRDELEPRYKDVSALGHNLSTVSLVKVDKLTEKLDAMLKTTQIAELRRLMAGRGKDVCEPATLLPEIARLFGLAMDRASTIVDAVDKSKFTGVDKTLDEFDAARDALFKEVHKIRHPKLANLVRERMLEPPKAFARGPAYRDATDAAAWLGKKSGLRDGWEKARKTAEARYETYTEEKGKKEKLFTAVKLDQGFTTALSDLEKARSKGTGQDSAKRKALTITVNYLKILNNLPSELKNATPDFHGELRSALLGILASLESDG